MESLPASADPSAEWLGCMLSCNPTPRLPICLHWLPAMHPNCPLILQNFNSSRCLLTKESLYLAQRVAYPLLLQNRHPRSSSLLHVGIEYKALRKFAEFATELIVRESGEREERGRGKRGELESVILLPAQLWQ